jgi:hypothetical protein
VRKLHFRMLQVVIIEFEYRLWKAAYCRLRFEERGRDNVRELRRHLSMSAVHPGNPI